MNVQESRIGRRVVIGLVLLAAAAVSAAPATINKNASRTR